MVPILFKYTLRLVQGVGKLQQTPSWSVSAPFEMLPAFSEAHGREN